MASRRTFLSDTLYGHDSSIKGDTYSLSKAKALMAKSSEPKGFDLTMQVESGSLVTKLQFGNACLRSSASRVARPLALFGWPPANRRSGASKNGVPKPELGNEKRIEQKNKTTRRIGGHSPPYATLTKH